MRIAIDAMSGDLGSAPVVEARRHFANEHKDATLVVVGKQEELESLKDLENVEIVDARDVVKMTDSVMSVRRKKESSLVKALMMARNDEVDGVVSCGSTGAYYTAAMLFVKRIEGVSKSCLMATLPTFNGQGTCLLDVGANAENTAEQLGDFAIMGSLYCKNVRDIGNPKVALLNIGAEPHKGDEMHQEAYKLLSKMKETGKVNFVGNIEGRDILKGDADVIVTDGFSGNIALKSTEGAALIVMKAVKEGLMSSTRGKIGALIAKPAIYSVKDKFDYKTVGGALMMGFDHALVKAHGASDAQAFESAMALTYKMVENHVVDQLREGLKA